MRPLLAGLACCLLIAGLSNCSSCGKKDRTLESMVPSDVAGALIFPDLAQSVKDVKALIEKFSVGPLATFINQGLLELNRVLGFDPLKLEELKKLGLDPRRGLALVPAGESPILVVGALNEKALDKEIKARMAQLMAAEDVSSASHDGFKITTISAKVGEQKSPQLLYGFSGGYVLLASPDVEPAQLARLANLKPEQSLHSASWYKTLRDRVPSKADMLVVINAEQAAKLGLGAQEMGKHISDGLVMAFSMSPSGLGADLYLGLDKASAQRLNGFTSGVKDAHLENYLPQDTLLAFKMRVNIGQALDELFGLDPDFKQEYTQAMASAKQSLGTDLEAGAVGNLTGNGVFGVSLGTPDQVSQLLKSLAEQPAEQMPEGLGSAFQMYYWMQIKDAAAWSQVLQNILPLATEKAGIQINQSTSGKLRFTELSGGELKLATFLIQKDDVIGGCVGKGCRETAAAILQGQKKGLTAGLSQGAKKIFSEPSFAVGYLNCAQLLQALQKMDAGVMGEGGMLAKMVLDLALTAIKNFRELTGVVNFLPQGVAFGAHLEIQ